MNVLILYRPASEHERVILDFLRDYEAQTGKKLETLDVDSSAGMDVCKTYDILQHPAILARDNDGRIQQLWQGLPLPLISEVSYYQQIN